MLGNEVSTKTRLYTNNWLFVSKILKKPNCIHLCCFGSYPFNSVPANRCLNNVENSMLMSHHYDL